MLSNMEISKRRMCWKKKSFRDVSLNLEIGSMLAKRLKPVKVNSLPLAHQARLANCTVSIVISVVAIAMMSSGKGWVWNGCLKMS